MIPVNQEPDVLPVACRFVLLFHQVSPAFQSATNRGDHFDLMFQLAGETRLKTWSLNTNPFADWDSLNSDQNSGTAHNLRPLATQLADHRPDFLDYEGPLSNGKGCVERVLSGNCRWDLLTDDKIQIRLQWQDQAGLLELVLLDPELKQWGVSLMPCE